ncbi:MAG TPA: 3'-5' exonuclease [Allocoleopsis sp.]
MPLLVLPQSAGRHGIKPELIPLPSFKQELTSLIDRLHQFHNQGIAWNQIAIIYRAKWMATAIYKALEQAHLPSEWVTKDHSSRYFQPQVDSIKLITMHSSKGLEFPVVIIPGIGFMPTQTLSVEEESRLLYVAMTRAIDRLIMTCDRPSQFVKRLEMVLNQVA